MKQIISRIFSYVLMFMIGAYATAQFKFGRPVEEFRWVMTSFFFVFFLIAARKT